jgi:hypothetical protein
MKMPDSPKAFVTNMSQICKALESSRCSVAVVEIFVRRVERVIDLEGPGSFRQTAVNLDIAKRKTQALSIDVQ